LLVSSATSARMGEAAWAANRLGAAGATFAASLRGAAGEVPDSGRGRVLLCADAESGGVARHPARLVRSATYTAGGLLLAMFVGMLLVSAWTPARPQRPTVAASSSDDFGAELVELASFPTPPSLFCFSVMRAGGSEQELVVSQFQHHASIFECNGYAVMSSHRFLLGKTDIGEVWTWVIPIPNVSTTEETVTADERRKSFLNAQTFITAWEALLLDGQLWLHDWTVKCDPDTVFFPDRLRLHVSPHQGASVYFTNCNLAETENPKLVGSLEVVSHEALRNYASNKERCKSGLEWQGWSESLYMQSCLDLLGVGHVFDPSLLGDSQCGPTACSDWTRVSFHPYKAVGSYMECFREAISPS